MQLNSKSSENIENISTRWEPFQSKLSKRTPYRFDLVCYLKNPVCIYALFSLSYSSDERGRNLAKNWTTNNEIINERQDGVSIALETLETKPWLNAAAQRTVCRLEAVCRNKRRLERIFATWRNIVRISRISYRSVGFTPPIRCERDCTFIQRY